MAAPPLFAPMPLTPMRSARRGRAGVARADLWPARRRSADLSLEQVNDAQRVMLRLGDRDRSIILPLVGDFQAANALAAAGLAIATGADAEHVLRALQRFRRCAADCSGSPASASGLRSMSIMRIRRTRWPSRWGATPACERTTRSSCSAVAAIATRQASGDGADRWRPRRSGDRHRRQSQERDPAEIRREILAGLPERGRDRRPFRGHPSGCSLAAGRRRSPGRRQGARDRPDRRLRVLPFDDAEVVRAAVRDLER